MESRKEENPVNILDRAGVGPGAIDPLNVSVDKNKAIADQKADRRLLVKHAEASSSDDESGRRWSQGVNLEVSKKLPSVKGGQIRHNIIDRLLKRVA